ncbi:MAG: hypothetical protein IJL58_03095 [Bacteroidales bacterium]|nr:hypothetical protein [Bacteroidales bacterium]
MKSQEEIKKVSYEGPEMEVINVRLEARILEGSTEGDHGCSDDVCDFD